MDEAAVRVVINAPPAHDMGARITRLPGGFGGSTRRRVASSDVMRPDHLDPGVRPDRANHPTIHCNRMELEPAEVMIPHPRATVVGSIMFSPGPAVDAGPYRGPFEIAELEALRRIDPSRPDAPKPWLGTPLIPHHFAQPKDPAVELYEGVLPTANQAKNWASLPWQQFFQQAADLIREAAEVRRETEVVLTSINAPWAMRYKYMRDLENALIAAGYTVNLASPGPNTKAHFELHVDWSAPKDMLR